MKHLNNILKSIPALLVAGMLFSCGANDLDEVNRVTAADNSAIEISKDVEMVYTDSGLVRARLNSPEVQRFAGEEEQLYAPKGVNVSFFDSIGRENSHLYAQRGTFYEKERYVELEDSVVVTNSAGERLNTEFLVWVQDSGFYTDKFVKITREKTIIYGDGLEADEGFSKYTIKKPRGITYLSTKEEELQDNDTIQ